MTYIRSRKHVGVYCTGAAIALAATISQNAEAQSAQPGGAAQPSGASGDTEASGHTLRNMVVKGEGDRTVTYKADVSASPKATASLLDTPQTITIVKESLFREQAATTLTEALRNVPGVGTFYLGENGSTSTGDAVYLRGADVSGSIFVDGVRDVASISRDVFNIDQIEVLKGAAGTDIGHGAATGAIDLITKQAKAQNAFSGSFGYGSADYRRGTADLNWAFAPGAGFRLNLLDQDADVAGRDRIRNDRWGVAPSLALGLGGATTFNLDYLHVTQHNIPDGGVPTIGLPGYSSPDPTRPFVSSGARVDSSNFYGLDNDHDDSTDNAVTAIVEHDFGGGLTLRNLTRWSQVDQRYQLSSFMAGVTQLQTPDPADPSTWTISRLINTKDVRNTTIANQTNLRGSVHTGFIEHTFSAGLEFIQEEQKNYTRAGVGTLPTVNLYDPSSAPAGYYTARTGAFTDGKTKTIGLYLNDTLQLSPQWQVTGGIRLDHYKTSYVSVTAAGVATPLGADGNLLSGRVGLVFKPASNASLYASYGVTQQPPGGANFSLAATNSANANNPDVSPQTARTYEAGGKLDVLSGALSLTAALYRTEYSDQILQDTDGTYYRAGNKRIQGVELGLVGQITPSWAINAGYTLMNTRVSSPTNQVVTADGSTVLAYNPTSAFTLWTTYKLPFGLTVGGGPQYVGKLKRGSDSAVGTPAYADAYWVLNAMASYQVTPRLQLQLNGYNLTDTDYVASINKSGYRYTPGVPRSVRLTANVSF